MDYVLLFTAALIAGTINAVAGGGSFFTFPALVFSGVPPVVANASSTVALFPAALASAWAYREDRENFGKVGFKVMFLVSIAGGTTGASILLLLPESAFDFIIPWLLLLATVAFVSGPRLMLAFPSRGGVNPAMFLAVQFVVSVYGGYFGGAVGLIMLSSWGLFGFTNLRMMNANKTLLAGLMNAAAVAVFVAARTIWWTETLVMLAAAVTGGYVGARVVRRMDPVVLRFVIIVISFGVTIAFFVRRYS